jgi:hypothetical protein
MICRAALLTLTLVDLTLGQGRPIVDEIAGATVSDAFVVGDVAFVVLEADIFAKGKPELELPNLLSAAKAVRNGTPSSTFMRLLSQSVGYQCRLSVDRVSAVNFGDSGFVWHLVWNIRPHKGGTSGPTSQYRAYVRADGSCVPPTLYLRDVTSLGECSLYSTLAIKRSPLPRKGPELTSDRIGQLALQKLENTLKRAKAAYGLRQSSIELVSLPLESNGGSGNGSIFRAYCVQVVLTRPNATENASNTIKIWVNMNGDVSEVTLDEWRIPKKGKQDHSRRH